MKIIFYWVLYPLIRPIYLVSLILNTLALASLIIAVSPLDRNGHMVHYIGKFWSLLNVFLAGARITVKGRQKIDKKRTYVIMSNHQSLFDIWALIGRLPLQLRWIIRSGIKKTPVFGYALERMGHIYIDRGSRENTAQGLRKAVQKAKEGTSVVIFPEGTRSRNGRLQRFHRGGAVIALGSGAPILPITVNGSRFVLPKGTLALMPGRIQVVVGDPIDPGSFREDQKDMLMAAVREVIEENLDPAYGSFV